MPGALLDELVDWLRIPSISTGGGDPRELERAARWVVERVAEAGGDARLERVGQGNPLAVGELRAARENAPTVLIYGHYDVQSPGPIEAWRTPPFEPVVEDGRVRARGAADDKGNFAPLLHVACALARDGTLPVHVRVLVEGEEETGSASVARWVAGDDRGADAAIVFDGAMVDADTPAITVGLRGLVQANLRVRTAERDLHSGLYGGSVLNALHVLVAALTPVLPGPDGRLRPELRAGIVPAADAERASWERLPPGDRVLAEVGGRPVHPGAGAEYYERNGADASLDVNAVHGGEPRTVVPARATATLTMRLAPRQRAVEMQGVIERLVHEALPAGAELEIDWQLGDPALFEPDDPVIRLAAAAMERATGTPPALVRTGGSIPVVAAFARRAIPTVVTGFVLAEDGIHAPNESYRLRSLELGEAAARELLHALAALPRG
jgi:acetylornithine deacetylase/succinyl-diaminopimelate desuccinylase-like protein